jgi:hypothetical protein
VACRTSIPIPIEYAKRALRGPFALHRKSPAGINFSYPFPKEANYRSITVPISRHLACIAPICILYASFHQLAPAAGSTFQEGWRSRRYIVAMTDRQQIIDLSHVLEWWNFISCTVCWFGVFSLLIALVKRLGWNNVRPPTRRLRIKRRATPNCEVEKKPIFGICK